MLWFKLGGLVLMMLEAVVVGVRIMLRMPALWLDVSHLLCLARRRA
jgi:hypothetical protein